MPDPKKKIMVKTPKKVNVEAEEAKKGIYDKETVSDAKEEGYVPKGLSKQLIKEIDETTNFNKRKNEVEAMAKSDSIVGAKKAKLEGKDIIDQRREGNAAANKTRLKEGNPQVLRGRAISHSSYPAGDKYTNTLNVNESGTSDIYSRTKPLEKDMPMVKKIVVKIKKK